MKLFPALILFFLSIPAAMAQVEERHSVKVLAEVPIQFGLGYEYQLSRHFSGGVQFGHLSKPNSTIILNTIQAMGAGDDIVLMIDDAFESGWVLEEGLNYHFRKSYIGVFLQQIWLSGSSTPVEIVESVMGVDYSDYPRRRNRRSQDGVELLLKSSLLQFGFLYGRRFVLKDKKSEINLEFGFSKNISSSSEISSETRNLDALSQDVDDFLTTVYRDYGYLPSLTIAFVRRF